MSFYGFYGRLGVHVMQSNRDVIRAARKRISARHRYGRARLPERKYLYREVLKIHASERALFLDVTRGNLG